MLDCTNKIIKNIYLRKHPSITSMNYRCTKNKIGTYLIGRFCGHKYYMYKPESLTYITFICDSYNAI